MDDYISIVPYVIHLHNAKIAGVHYDLRIKYPNKNLAASWALPKAEMPKKPGEKVLAVKVHDHGRYWLYIDNLQIPDGERGAGSVKIIQKGKAKIYGWGKNHITFSISGPVAAGRFSLVQFKAKEKNIDTWFIIKTLKQE